MTFSDLRFFRTTIHTALTCDRRCHIANVAICMHAHALDLSNHCLNSRYSCESFQNILTIGVVGETGFADLKFFRTTVPTALTCDQR